MAHQWSLRGLAILACAIGLHAQDPNAPAQAPAPAGLETDWDAAATLRAISEHADRLLPLLEKIDVYAWVEKGASDTYLAQLQSSKVQARALSESAKMLAASPQKLSASFDLYLRIKGLDSMLGSLQEGIRKYQGPAVAQSLASLQAEGSASQERFQRYIVELASQRERDLEVMDHEAQRCRAIVTQAAPKTSGPVRKK
jgi:hypothetical protein